MRSHPILALALLLLAAPASAEVQVEPSRIDLPTQNPGDTIHTILKIRNSGSGPSTYEIAAEVFQAEEVTVSPSRMALPAGASQDVQVTIRLADDAAGGRHDIRINVIEGAEQGERGVGARAAVRAPIIFSVENLKVASLNVDPDAGIATAMVFNHFPRDTQASLVAAITDATGTQSRVRGDDAVIASDRHSFLSIQFTPPAGEFTIRVWAEHPEGRSNAMEQTRGAAPPLVTIGSVVATRMEAGHYRLSTQVVNTGGTEVPVQVQFRINGQQEQTIFADGVVLQPGQEAVTEAAVRLPPGTYSVVAVAQWDDQESTGPANEIQVEESVDDTRRPIPGVGAAVVIAAVLFWLRRAKS